MDLAGYVDAFGNITAIGAIVLLFWRMTNHTLPRIASDFKDGVDKSWIHCQATIKDQRNDFKELLERQRSDFSRALEQHKLVCQNDLNQLRQSVEKKRKLGEKQMSLTNYFELKVLDDIMAAVVHGLPASLYFGLSTADPTEDGSGLAEPSGNAYARVTMTRNATNFNAAAAGAIDNTTVITFPTATGSWGICTHLGVWDAATTGNLLMYNALTTSRTINNGMTPSYAAGAFILTLD